MADSRVTSINSVFAECTPKGALSALAVRRLLSYHATVTSVTPTKTGSFTAELQAVTLSLPANIQVNNIMVEIKQIDRPNTKRRVANEGTVYNVELGSTSEEELLAELGPSVTAVERLTTRGVHEGSGRFALQFKDAVPPQVKLACGLILEVRIHVRMPLRCRKCLAYGHHEQTCNDAQKCTGCALNEHPGSPCTLTRCAACSGDHAVTDPICSVYRMELEAKRIQLTAGISRVAALERVKASARHEHEAFAQSFAPASLPAVSAWNPAHSPQPFQPPQPTQPLQPTQTASDNLIDMIRAQTAALQAATEQMAKPHPVLAEMATLMQAQTSSMTKMMEQNTQVLETVQKLLQHLTTGRQTRQVAKSNSNANGPDKSPSVNPKN